MKLVVGHLYPDYLNIYADRGNIAVLERRTAWRGIELDKLVSNLYGNADDNAKGRQMPVHYSFSKQNFVSVSSPIGT